MTVLSLTGHDPTADRATLQALVDFQAGTPAAGLPRRTREHDRSALALWRARAEAAAAQPFAERQRQAFERAFVQLVDAVHAQPAVALLDGAQAGPLTADIARLLRARAIDEAVELDLAVRWWQRARAAGLPVDPDFGECFRLLEWTWLLQLLGQAQPDGAGAVKVALRYAPLKPLLLLLEPLTGAPPRAGFTF